jgi:hypothetical protein
MRRVITVVIFKFSRVVAAAGVIRLFPSSRLYRCRLSTQAERHHMPITGRPTLKLNMLLFLSCCNRMLITLSFYSSKLSQANVHHD